MTIEMEVQRLVRSFRAIDSGHPMSFECQSTNSIPPDDTLAAYNQIINHMEINPMATTTKALTALMIQPPAIVQAHDAKIAKAIHHYITISRNWSPALGNLPGFTPGIFNAIFENNFNSQAISIFEGSIIQN